MAVIEESFYDKVNHLLINKKCTLEDFIITSVTDKELRNYIIGELSESELKMNLNDNVDRSLDIIHKYSLELERFHEEARDATFSYYSNMFKEYKNILLVDCGFSGTIANYMTQIFEREKIQETVEVDFHGQILYDCSVRMIL